MLISRRKAATIPPGLEHKRVHQRAPRRAAPIQSNLYPRALYLHCISIANVNHSYTLHDPVRAYLCKHASGGSSASRNHDALSRSRR